MVGYPGLGEAGRTFRDNETWQRRDIQLAGVLAHELGHVHNRDFIVMNNSVSESRPLAEGQQEYAMLTTVRLRNIASAEEIW